MNITQSLQTTPDQKRQFAQHSLKTATSRPKRRLATNLIDIPSTQKVLWRMGDANFQPVCKSPKASRQKFNASYPTKLISTKQHYQNLMDIKQFLVTRTPTPRGPCHVNYAIYKHVSSISTDSTALYIPNTCSRRNERTYSMWGKKLVWQ